MHPGFYWNVIHIDVGIPVQKRSFSYKKYLSTMNYFACILGYYIMHEIYMLLLQDHLVAARVPKHSNRGFILKTYLLVDSSVVHRFHFLQCHPASD